jgi:hypothetical protein
MLAARRAVLRIALPIAVVALLVAALLAARQGHVPLVSSRLSEIAPVITLEERGGDELDMARAARDMTPAGTLLLTPPDFGRFRLASRRGIVADFKGMPFLERDIRPWRRRIEDLYGPTTGGGHAVMAEMRDNWRRVGDARLVELARRYGATHAVLYTDTSTALPQLYRNATYRLVALPEAGPDAACPGK